MQNNLLDNLVMMEKFSKLCKQSEDNEEDDSQRFREYFVHCVSSLRTKIRKFSLVWWWLEKWALVYKWWRSTQTWLNQAPETLPLQKGECRNDQNVITYLHRNFLFSISIVLLVCNPSYIVIFFDKRSSCIYAPAPNKYLQSS